MYKHKMEVPNLEQSRSNESQWFSSNLMDPNVMGKNEETRMVVSFSG